MGIPYYFSYILRNHKKILSEYRYKKGILYLDANSIIYDNLDNNENVIFNNVYKHINEIVKLFNPIKTYIAFDGIAPFAKMKQQKERRYKSYISKQILNKTSEFNTNKITPGTSFMNNLNTFLYSKFKDKNIIVSGSDKEGEGEFKIFNFIRNENIELNHIIYGLDADLIMLSLINYPYKIFLYRETKYFLYFKHINKDKKYLLNTTMLAEQISIGLYNNIFNIKRAVNQYCFLSFLCGNDFLPHSPFINIRNGGLETIFSNFKIIKNDIVSNDKIIWSTLKQLFINLSIKEDELLNKHIEWKKQRRFTDITEEDKLNSLPLKDMDIENILYLYPEKYNELLFNTIDDEEICKNYIEMLDWTWKYYKGNIDDNTKYYKYSFTPKFSSLINISKKITYNEKITINPITQLIYVLPYVDYNLIPYKDLDMITNKYCELKKMNFKIDYSFCRYFWESHVSIYPVDIYNINKLIVSSNIYKKE